MPNPFLVFWPLHSKFWSKVFDFRSKSVPSILTKNELKRAKEVDFWSKMGQNLIPNFGIIFGAKMAGAKIGHFGQKPLKEEAKLADFGYFWPK